MNDSLPAKSGLININSDNLWRLETIGDLEHAEIQIYHPIKPDGSPDEARAVRYCSLMDISFRGAHAKLRFDIPATSLEEALANFVSAGEAFGYAKLEELESARMKAMLAAGGTIGIDPRDPNLLSRN